MAYETYYIGNALSLTSEVQRDGATIDISGADTFEIRYKKPDGTIGAWTGAVSGTHQITYDITDEIDAAGVWYLKAYAEYASGIYYQGDPVAVEFRRKWQSLT